MILIIDDDSDVRRVISHIVRRLGFSTLEANSGSQGIDLFQSYPDRIRCVLLDLSMPDADIELILANLRTLHATVPIIIMSGRSEAEMHDHLQSAKPDGFLAKPFTLVDIRNALQRFVDIPSA